MLTRLFQIVKKRYKIYFLLCCLYLPSKSYCAGDTIVFTNRAITIFFSSYSCENGRYHIGRREVTKSEYENFKMDHDSVEKLLDSATGKYCRIYNEKQILIEEGVWHPEFFSGYYRKYYSNGKLKEEGRFTPMGMKIGIWKYYKRNGKLRKRADYWGK